MMNYNPALIQNNRAYHRGKGDKFLFAPKPAIHKKRAENIQLF